MRSSPWEYSFQVLIRPVITSAYSTLQTDSTNFTSRLKNWYGGGTYLCELRKKSLPPRVHDQEFTTGKAPWILKDSLVVDKIDENREFTGLSIGHDCWKTQAYLEKSTVY